MSKFLSTLEFKDLARGGPAARATGATVYRLATDVPVEVEGMARTLHFTYSDETVDRAGDRIVANGWDLENYLKNPISLWAHQSSAPPIGRSHNVKISKKRLVGDIEFAPPETYEFADTIFRLIKGGYIRAVSVGFIPQKWQFVDDKERQFGIDFLEQELLEISPCPVPCNPNALQEARAKGIDTRPLVMWAEKTLDEGGFAAVSKDELEQLRHDAAELANRIKTPDPVPPPVVETKGGRRISAANIGLLQQALDHHEACAKCIRDVMASNDPNDPDADDDTTVTDPTEDTDPAKRRAATRRWLAEHNL